MSQVKVIKERPKTSAGAKVTVACKLPNGLVLRTFAMVEKSELVMGGGSRVVKSAVPTGGRVIVNGNARRLGEDPRCRVVGGYAITEGVDKEIWDSWLEDNRESAMVVNNLVFAEETTERTVARARELVDIRSGMEPLEKDNDPRTPKPKNRVLSQVTEEEESAKKRAAG